MRNGKPRRDPRMGVTDWALVALCVTAFIAVLAAAVT